MKFLICGAGSIGERHARNLLALGEKDISILRRRKVALRTISNNFKTFTSLSEAIKSRPKVAFITNPTSLHIPLAIELAKAGCNLFIEKPLSSSLKDVNTLMRIVKKRKVVVQMGFMMRYHPAFIQIKKWIDEKTIGYPLSARASWGEYLPSWHPWENYKNSYSSRTDLGGGPIFTLCHDIDLSIWLFGNVNNVFSLKAKKSSLGISSEDNVEILMEYINGVIFELHLDYISFPPKRTWDIIGNTGRIEFDYYNNKLTLFKRKQDQVEKINIRYNNFDRNDMFIAEIKDFIGNIKKKNNPITDLKSGIVNLNILLSIHKSIKEKKVVNIKQVNV